MDDTHHDSVSDSSESMSFYTDALSNFSDDQPYRSGSTTPTPTIPPMSDVSRTSSADISMHSGRTCMPMDTSPIVGATIGPVAPNPSHNMPMQSLFDLSSTSTTMPIFANMLPTTNDQSMLPHPMTPSTLFNPSPSNHNTNYLPQFSDSFNFSTDNFLPNQAHSVHPSYNYNPSMCKTLSRKSHAAHLTGTPIDASFTPMPSHSSMPSLASNSSGKGSRI